jgi:hypothetical protein
LVLPDTADHNYGQFANAVDHLLFRLGVPNLCSVLIHCQAGVSRSSAVCTAALAVKQQYPFADSFDQVNDARRKVSPLPALEISAKRYIEERPDDLPDDVPGKATITIKEINDNRYYYWQWREGEKVTSKYKGPVNPEE